MKIDTRELVDHFNEKTAQAANALNLEEGALKHTLKVIIEILTPYYTIVKTHVDVGFENGAFTVYVEIYIEVGPEMCDELINELEGQTNRTKLAICVDIISALTHRARIDMAPCNKARITPRRGRLYTRGGCG